MREGERGEKEMRGGKEGGKETKVFFYTYLDTHTHMPVHVNILYTV